MASVIPARVRWAVETLAVGPADRVLEIGCGSGLAAALICERLIEGRMLAIDRSATQIERARRRNEAHIASGRLRLQTVALAALDTGGERVETVFAINVNIFWLGPATEELDSVRRALEPGATLHLFYEAPAPARAREVVARASGVLRAGGFAEPEVLAADTTRLCFISSPL